MSTLQMEIKSNSGNKLRKMTEGVIFNDPLIFVTEFVQNAQRAETTSLTITVDKVTGEVVFQDAGVGIDNFENLLTLDKSSWDSTNEGYGIGFWSWLGFRYESIEKELIGLDSWDKIELSQIADIECTIYSKDKKLSMSRRELVTNDIPKTGELVTSANYVNGFKIVLNSEVFKNEEVYNELMARIIKDTDLMNFDVFLNNTLVEKRNLLEGIEGDFIQTYDSPLFKTSLSIYDGYGQVEMYYEDRFVCNFGRVENIKGTLILKKGTLDLKEPDRRSFSYNEKLYTFEEELEGCRYNLYKDFVKHATDEELDIYDEQIIEILKVEDYQELIVIKDLETELKDDQKKKQEEELENTQEVEEELSREKKISFTNSNTESSMEDVEDETMINLGIADEKESDSLVKTERAKGNADLLKRTSKNMWVTKDEYIGYEDSIKLAEYYGFKVYISRNLLFKRVFEAKNIPHISLLKNSIKKNYIQKDVFLKTNKEKRLISLLQPVCDLFDLPYNTFNIGELEMETNIIIDGEELSSTKEVNSKKKLNVYAVCLGYERKIILDRRALDLTRFLLTLNNQGIGIHDLKAIMSVLNTVSHELAHLLYGTQDNTEEHFKAESQIADKITKLYISL